MAACTSCRGGLQLRQRPAQWPPIVPGGAACSPDFVKLAQSPAVEFLSNVLGIPYAGFLQGYCTTGTLDGAGKATAKSFASSMRTQAIVLPLAAAISAVIFPPAAIVLGAIAPIPLVLLPVFQALSEGRAPNVGDMGKALATVGAAAGPVIGADNAKMLADTAGVIGAAADEAGVTLPSFDLTRALPGEDDKKAQLRKAKAKALAIESAKAKARAKTLAANKAPAIAAAKEKARAATEAAKKAGTLPSSSTGAVSKLFGFIRDMPAPVKIAAATFIANKVVRGR